MHVMHHDERLGEVNLIERATFVKAGLGWRRSWSPARFCHHRSVWALAARTLSGAVPLLAASSSMPWKYRWVRGAVHYRCGQGRYEILYQPMFILGGVLLISAVLAIFMCPLPGSLVIKRACPSAIRCRHLLLIALEVSYE